MAIISWLLIGLIVGAVARLLVRGRHRLGLFGTIGLGLLGSVVGGTILNVLTGEGFTVAPAGFLGSVVGAVGVLLIGQRLGASSR